jgi:hypothetical protein
MKNLVRLAAFIVICSSFSAADAQSVPGVRGHHSLAYDPVRKAIVLTAGSTPLDGGQRFDFYNDIWEFDGTKWTRVGASGDSISGIALAYDSKRSRIMSFGGYTGSAKLGDLRVLESNQWKKIGINATYSAAEAGFVYDAARDRFVAFGGSPGQGQAHGDTWEYAGEKWSKLAITSPPARQAHAMVYDERRGRTVVFGGLGAGQPGQRPPMFGDTWEFDGTSWKRFDVPGPSARSGAGMTYDSKRGVVILFGGAGETGFAGDTWSWNGAEWKQLATSGPDPRGMGYMAYDKGRDRVVLFGGRKGWPNGDLNDTWEWDGTAWHQVNVQGGSTGSGH